MPFRLGERWVDLDAATVRHGTELLPLTAMEVKLLRYLADRLGQVVGRDLLLVEVWGYRPGVRSRTVDNVVRRLREKIEADPSAPAHLLVVYGLGLQLVGVAEMGDTKALPAGRFVGRGDELGQARQAWADGVSLITICGPPGVGKTRLAREVVADADRPVVFVEVGPARDAHDLAVAVAVALGIAGAGDADQILPEALAGRGLLVLDECERLAEVVAARIRAWKSRARSLQVLVTSRRPLQIEGELRILLAPLSDAEGSAMFVDRAQLVVPSFVADATELQDLVTALDGLPLAIELAAARASVRSVSELTALVRSRVELGSGGGMRAAVDGSWALLDPDQQRLLAELSVFEAPFSFDDAVGVTALSRPVALERLQTLVDHGLVRMLSPPRPLRAGIDDAGTRYALYTVVRARALEALGPDDEVFDRHAGWFARLGARSTLEELDADPVRRPLLRAAAADLQAVVSRSHEPQVVARCLLALLWRLAREGPMAQGLALATRAQSIRCIDETRVGIAIQHGLLRKRTAEHALGLTVTDDAVALATDPSDIVTLRVLRSLMLEQVGRWDDASAEMGRAAPFAAASRRSQPVYLKRLALMQSEPDDGERLLLEAARISRTWDDPVGEAEALSVLGRMWTTHGNWTKATIYLGRALDRFGRDPPAARSRSSTLTFAGSLEARRGNLARAEALLGEARDEQVRIGNSETLEFTRIELARVALQRGDPARAIDELYDVLAGILMKPSWSAAIGYLALAECEYRAGRFGRARQAVETSFEHARPGQYYLTICGALGVSALLDAREGRIDAARRALREAETVGLYPGHRIRHYAVDAIVEAHAGNPEAARRLLPAVEMAERLQLEVGSDLLQWVRLAEEHLDGRTALG